MKPETPATDYTLWRLMAWCGPIFLTIFFFMWGVLAGNLPPAGAHLDAAAITQHYLDHRFAILLGMSVCMVGGAFYMPWGLAVSRLMQRIEGPDGMLSKLEMMGATITCAPIIIACGIWCTCAHEAASLPPALIHMLYWMGWLVIDLAYMVTTFQIFAVSLVFLRDRREHKLVPNWVSWWGFLTCATFFPVSLIPFLTTGPFAFHGLFNFWVAFFAWYIWVVSLSTCVIRGITRVQVEDGALAAAPAREAPRGGVTIAAARGT